MMGSRGVAMMIRMGTKTQASTRALYSSQRLNEFQYIVWEDEQRKLEADRGIPSRGVGQQQEYLEKLDDLQHHRYMFLTNVAEIVTSPDWEGNTSVCEV
jgi:hypothetical protein